MSIRLKLVAGAVCVAVIFGAGFYAGTPKGMIGGQARHQEARTILDDRFPGAAKNYTHLSRYVLGVILRDAEKEGVKLDPVRVAEIIIADMGGMPGQRYRTLVSVDSKLIPRMREYFSLRKDEDAK